MPRTTIAPVNRPLAGIWRDSLRHGTRELCEYIHMHNSYGVSKELFLQMTHVNTNESSSTRPDSLTV